MCTPVKLTVHNFGPIKNAELITDKYTVILGPQGSGKSTLAKLFSLFTWMEKGLALCTLTPIVVEKYSRFQKNYCKYHRIDSFFKDNTYIKYEGVNYGFVYENGKLFVDGCAEDDPIDYDVAKVIYIPAERGYLSLLTKTTNIKGMPDSMQAFLDVFKEAEKERKTGYALPIGDATFEYDSLNDTAWIKGIKDNYKIRLSAASSGFRSMLPMMLVSQYLSDWVSQKVEYSRLNHEEQENMRKEVKKVMLNDKLSEDIKMAMLQTLSSRFRYSRFVNIVEEPEQNLYPESQRLVLYDLIFSTNKLTGNQIFITTHSPYFINFLTLAVKAFIIKRVLDTHKSEELLNALNCIVPHSAQINPEKLHIYEINNGNLELLPVYDGGLPSDENSLNIELGHTNELFDQLLEIEDGINDVLQHEN